MYMTVRRHKNVVKSAEKAQKLVNRKHTGNKSENIA